MSTEASETGLWYKGFDGVRVSEIPLVVRAAKNLGGLIVRVIEDAEQSRRIVFDGAADRYSKQFPNETTGVLELAATDAERFVQNMQPNTTNGQNPTRLVWVESTDGAAVLPHEVAEEIKFRIRPALQGEPISPDELLHSTLNPVDPQTLFEE